jgi:hypothetical protein
MTDRARALLVVLQDDIRVDDVEQLRQAILSFRGVVNVAADIASPDDWINRERVKSELRDKILELLYPNPPYKKMT